MMNKTIITVPWLAFAVSMAGFFSPNSPASTDLSLNLALEKLDAAFGKHVMDWTASLYDVESGGFYFSGSARDNEGFAADIETTAQMVGIWRRMGLIPRGKPPEDIMPRAVREGMVQFMQKRQDPDDGYFYDTQFGKDVNDSKKARNLSQAISIINRFGGEVPYETAAERLADRRQSSGIQEQFKSREAFEQWMKALPWESNPYSAGHTMSSTTRLIRAAGFLEIAQDYVTSIQNTGTGLWGDDLSYRSLNGAMKTASLFNRDRPYPHMNEMLKSVIYVVNNFEPNTTATLWNPLSLVIKARNSHGGRFTDKQQEQFDASLAELLTIMADNLAKFRQPDNGYSWSQQGSSRTSQGVHVSLAKAEGDVNGTALAAMLRNDAYRLAGVTPPPLWDQYRDAYWAKLLNAAPIEKKP